MEASPAKFQAKYPAMDMKAIGAMRRKSNANPFLKPIGS